MTTNDELDRALGGDYGESPIRFARDADQVLGRIRKDGGWDRRYRIKHPAPEPIEPEGWAFVVQVVGGLVIFGGLFLALWFWLAVAAASQVTP